VGATADAQRIVVVGASLAGLRGAEAMRAAGFRGNITLVGAEPHFPPYDRPPLSKQVLTGQLRPEKAQLRAEDDLGLELRLGQRADGLDLLRREVSVGGGALPFDGLMIATGVTPRPLPGPDAMRLAGVFTLRTLEDCLRLRERLAGAASVAVVGAGFIGCEVAASCRALGLRVTLIDALAAPMERAIGRELGTVLAGLHARHGVRLRLARPAAGLAGRDEVTGVLLADGELVEADAVVVALGAAPATGWLEGSGLWLADGLRCDQQCFALRADGVAAAAVVAAGDVTRWEHPFLGSPIRVEHWTNAVGQAQAAGRNLAGALRGQGEREAYADVPYFWSDQYDWKVQFAGVARGAPVIEEGDPETGRFVACYRAAGRLAGVLCVNWPARFSRYRRAVAEEWRAGPITSQRG
jgi:3-phenylpropionate/trans-cinnamate dioxygenase ferredoxin reductase subunit